MLLILTCFRIRINFTFELSLTEVQSSVTHLLHTLNYGNLEDSAIKQNVHFTFLVPKLRDSLNCRDSVCLGYHDEMGPASTTQITHSSV